MIRLDRLIGFLGQEREDEKERQEQDAQVQVKEQIERIKNSVEQK